MTNASEPQSVTGNQSPTENPALEVRGLKKYFDTDGGWFSESEPVKAVDGVDLRIEAGSTYGLVGESGSGKSTLGEAILRITEPTEGDIRITGVNVSKLSPKKMREFRKNISIIFQDPTSSLNPRKTAENIIADPLRIHNIGTEAERRERILEAMAMVDLPESYLTNYPHELSGGQCQRLGIARAIVTNPKLIVLDEPTSALDVSVQARIVNILEEIQEEYDIAYLFISHNLTLVRNIADVLGVMYSGRIVETGPVETVYRNPMHPYTEALLSSIPVISEQDKQFIPGKLQLEGEIPDPRNRPSGCVFRTRCPEVFGPCSGEEPNFYDVGEKHQSRCYLHDEEYQSGE